MFRCQVEVKGQSRAQVLERLSLVLRNLARGDDGYWGLPEDNVRYELAAVCEGPKVPVDESFECPW